LIILNFLFLFLFTTIQDDDDDDFGGPALGGRLDVRSDSDEDEDEPPQLGKLTEHNRPTHLSPPTRKPFRMEVVDF
jgi:hypothetical protein